jgi:hypothetical protein
MLASSNNSHHVPCFYLWLISLRRQGSGMLHLHFPSVRYILFSNNGPKIFYMLSFWRLGRKSLHAVLLNAGPKVSTCCPFERWAESKFYVHALASRYSLATKQRPNSSISHGLNQTSSTRGGCDLAKSAFLVTFTDCMYSPPNKHGSEFKILKLSK